MLTSFYQAVLPSTGQFCLFLLGSGQHVWAGSIDSLLDHTEARADQQGVYFGTAGYGTKLNDKGQVARSQANVLALRSLRLDIDAGPEKVAKIEARIAAGKLPESARETVYMTQRDAILALVAFSKATKLAPSYIVSSGAGLHVYYVLDQDLTPAAWIPLATRLQALGEANRLRVDPTCTIDTARILRPIGSLHPSGTRVSVLKDTGKVYAVNEITELLGVTEAGAVTAPKRTFDMSVNADVAMAPGPPKLLSKILDNCAAMKEVAQAKGDVTEPHWRAMLGIVKFTVEGLNAAHELSHGHPDYDPDETERKFNAWATGPTSCKEFAKHTAKCAVCPHNGKIKSPVMVGQMTPEQVGALPLKLQPAAPKQAAPTGDAWDGLLPPKFSVTQAGDGTLTLVYTTEAPKKDETGATIMVPINIPVTHNIFWLTHWGEAEGSDDTALASGGRWDPGDGKTSKPGVRPFNIEQGIVPNQMKLLEHLAKQGIQTTTHPKAAQAMADFLKANLLRIQTMHRRPKVNGRFGLRYTTAGDLISAHGLHCIMPDGTIIEGMLSVEMRSVAVGFPITALPGSESGEWPATVWEDYINPAAQKHALLFRTHYGAEPLRKLQLAIMLGLASPLMAFVTGSYHTGLELPANGLSVSLFSRPGGKGKTTLIEAVSLAYGNPAVLTKGAGKTGSTELARINKLSHHGTMPMVMDEMGGSAELSIASIISAVANGAARQRLTQSGGVNDKPPWALINLITTNRSQREMLNVADSSSDAIQHRLLELNVEGIIFSDDNLKAWEIDWAEAKRDCNGALGAVLERAICQEGAAKMNALVTGAVAKARELIGAKQAARFQYRALGAVLAAHILFKRMGIELFDLKGLVEEFRLAHDSGVSFAAETTLPTDGLELMQLMLNDLKPKTLITESETHRGLDKSKFDIPLNARVPDVVVARHISLMGHTYLAGAAVREWCAEKKVSERDMVTAAKNAGVLLVPYVNNPKMYSIQIDLFKGTKEADTVIARCYKIDTNRLRRLCDGSAGAEPDLTNVTPITITPKAKPTPEAPPQLESEA